MFHMQEGYRKTIYNIQSRIGNVLKWSRYENRVEKKENNYFMALFIYSVHRRVN
jgi:hypothetical protein